MNSLLYSRDKLSWVVGVFAIFFVLAVYSPLTGMTLYHQTNSYDYESNSAIAFSLAISQVANISSQSVDSYNKVMDDSLFAASSLFFDKVSKGVADADVIADLVYNLGALAPPIRSGDPTTIFGPILGKYKAAVLTANATNTAEVQTLASSIAADIKGSLKITDGKKYLESIALDLIYGNIQPILTLRSTHLLQEAIKTQLPPKDSVQYQTLNGQAMAGFGITNFLALDMKIDAVTFVGMMSGIFLKNVVDEDVYYKFYFRPVMYISMAIIFIYTLVCFLFWNEPEIRSKYRPFLIHMLLSANLSIILVVLVIEIFDGGKTDVIAVALSFLIFWFYSLFSAMNCRHRLMYNIFVRYQTQKMNEGNKNGYFQKIKHSYFFPCFWHYALIIVSIIYSEVIRNEVLYKEIDTFVGISMAMVVTCLLFFGESLFYIYHTRNSSSKYVDFWFNIRVFLVFVTVMICGMILLGTVPYAIEHTTFYILNCFYICVTFTIYVLDGFTLIFLKIIFRKYEVKILGNVEFMAQNGVYQDLLSKILSSKDLAPKLIDIAKERLCEENIYFLLDTMKFEKKIRGSKVLKKKEMNEFYQQYFGENAARELNLIDTTKRQLRHFENLDEEETINQDMMVLLFDKAIVEIKKLVQENIMKEFLDKYDIDVGNCFGEMPSLSSHASSSEYLANPKTSHPENLEDMVEIDLENE